MERVLLAAGLLALTMALVTGGRWWVDRRRRASVASLQATDGAPRSGAMRILFFTTPTCIDCRYRQRPALDELERRFGPRLTVETVDALADREIARKFRVLTVPTTAVFDASGRLVDINYGFTPAETLTAQLTTTSV